MLNPLTAVLSVNRLVQYVKGGGLTVDLSEDFERFWQVNQQAERGPLTPILDIRRTAIEDGFWLEGRDSAGSLAHLQAARLVDLDGLSLQDHLQENRDLYLSLGLAIDPWKSDARGCPATASMYGRICYHGEVWLASSTRGTGLGPILIRLMMTLALVRWQPDYFIGLSVPKTSNPAFARKMGYGHFLPAAVSWNDGSGRSVRDEGLVWSELQDLLDLVREEGLGEILGDRRETSETVTVRK